MSKKDYIKFAKMLAEEREFLQSRIEEPPYQSYNFEMGVIANKIADIFADDNPNFDNKRFLKACGLE